MLSALSGSLEWHAANFAKKVWTAAMSAKKRHREPLCTVCGNTISSCKNVHGCGQTWDLVNVNSTDVEAKKVWRHERCGEQHIQTGNWCKSRRIKQCCAGRCSGRDPDEVGGRRDGSEMAQCCAAPLIFMYVCQVAEETVQQAGGGPTTVTNT